MKSLFDDLSIEISKITTRTYSTSFSLGIWFLNKSVRNAIYSIYGFVRLADEIVDSFEGYDKRSLLKKFERETYDSIAGHISLNPILNSFQKAVNHYHIKHELIGQFFESMEMDLEKTGYTTEKYDKYILGSAESVGLMCLQVFTNNQPLLYDELKFYAMKLGSAFQKVNFLRDMRDDYKLLGRVYFPNVLYGSFTREAKEQIEQDIANDFSIALLGIKKLPHHSRGGVYLAYNYYQSLFDKIKRLPPEKILAERIRISNGRKLGLMINSLLEHKMNFV
jgi:phytoene synthase